MSEPASKLMDVDEFLVWEEGQEGRWELHDGVVVAMPPERLVHLETKANVYMSLAAAIHNAKAPCRAYPDGAAVRIALRTAFEPDALVRWGPPLPRDAPEIPDPFIVVEVLSPSTEAFDRGMKLEGYFSLASVQHYLIVDAERRKVVHHKRGPGDWIETRIINAGQLWLDPPRIDLAIESFFEPV